MELIDLVNSVLIYISQMTLLRWLTFLLRSLTVTLALQLWPFGFISFFWWFLSFDGSIWSTMAFPQLENSDHVVSVSIGFLANSKRDALFHCLACNYCADWDSLRDHIRDSVLLLLLVNLWVDSGWNWCIHPLS